MKQILGSQLEQSEQSKALACFVHRFTAEHVPQWVQHSNKKPICYFASDADWLNHTLFWIRNDGKLSEKHRYCESEMI
jgi:hypothetical protein